MWCQNCKIVSAWLDVSLTWCVSFSGGQNSSLNSSQIVRQGLRAVVSGRTQQTNIGNNNNTNNTIRRNLASPLDPMGPNSGALVDNNANNNNPNSLMMNQQQQQLQQLPGNMINSSDIDPSMRFNFDMSQGEIWNIF